AVGGENISLFGEDGNNLFQLTGTSVNPLSVNVNDLNTFGPVVSQTDGAPTGINALAFPGVNGITIDLSKTTMGVAPTPSDVQQVAPDLAVTLTGLFQNVVGTPGDDLIKGNSSMNVLDGGGAGNDTLTAGSGPATLVAGSGNDLLVAGSGGTVYQFGAGAGNVTVDPPGGLE